MKRNHISALLCVSMLLMIAISPFDSYAAKIMARPHLNNGESYGAFVKRVSTEFIDLPADADKFLQKVDVVISLGSDGSVIDVDFVLPIRSDDKVNQSPLRQAVEQAISRGIRRAAPYSELPVGEYKNWKTLEIGFNISEMYR